MKYRIEATREYLSGPMQAMSNALALEMRGIDPDLLLKTGTIAKTTWRYNS